MGKKKNEKEEVRTNIYVSFSLCFDFNLIYTYHASQSDAAKLSILPISFITLFNKYLCFTTYHII